MKTSIFVTACLIAACLVLWSCETKRKPAFNKSKVLQELKSDYKGSKVAEKPFKTKKPFTANALNAPTGKASNNLDRFYEEYLKRCDKQMAIFRNNFKQTTNPTKICPLFKTKQKSKIEKVRCGANFPVKIMILPKDEPNTWFYNHVLVIGDFILTNYNGKQIDKNESDDASTIEAMTLYVDTAVRIFANNREFVAVQLVSLYGMMSTQIQAMENELLVYEITRSPQRQIRCILNKDYFFPTLDQIDDFDGDGQLDLVHTNYLQTWGYDDSLLFATTKRLKIPESQIRELNRRMKETANIMAQYSSHYIHAELLTLSGDKFVPKPVDYPYKKEWFGFVPTYAGDSTAFQLYYK